MSRFYLTCRPSCRLCFSVNLPMIVVAFATVRRRILSRMAAACAKGLSSEIRGSKVERLWP
jgi:hypothetical protein